MAATTVVPVGAAAGCVVDFDGAGLVVGGAAGFVDLVPERGGTARTDPCDLVAVLGVTGRLVVGATEVVVALAATR